MGRLCGKEIVLRVVDEEVRLAMRIGVICPYSFDEPGGVQAHILDLAEHLIGLGHHVEVLGPAHEDTALPDYVHKGGGSLPIPYNGSVARIAFGPKARHKVREFIAQGNFDVLHIHEPNSPSFSLHALMEAKGPIVATYHASSSKSRALAVALPLLRPHLEKIRAGIAVSEMARRWQVQMLGGDPVLIPNGIHTAAFRPDKYREVDDSTALADLKLVFLGRIDESRKGLDVLLDALSLLETKPSTTVIGGGAPRATPGVKFVGRVSDAEKARILQEADVYVAPNLGGESFGIVLVEAMAAGCCVLASDLEAFAAVCDAEGPQPAGMLFRTGDAKALAKAIVQLAQEPTVRHQLQQSAIQRAELYDWQTVAEQVLRVYETVADGTTVGIRGRDN